jgi:uncharacterized protein
VIRTKWHGRSKKLLPNNQYQMMHELSSQSEAWWARFQELLDDQIEWPDVYTFKFIVPSDELEQMRSIFRGQPIKVRESRKGNYLSITARMQMASSHEVIEVYQQAATVQGVISL